MRYSDPEKCLHLDADRVVAASGTWCGRCGTKLTGAVARRSDPDTSHEAAKQLTTDGLRACAKAVLNVLRSHGPMIDEELVERVEPVGPYSPSGIRSRRAELVRAGLVEAAGTGVTASGRRSQVWRAKN